MPTGLPDGYHYTGLGTWARAYVPSAANFVIWPCGHGLRNPSLDLLASLLAHIFARTYTPNISPLTDLYNHDTIVKANLTGCTEL